MITKQINDFNLSQIDESGQCFRMKQINDSKYYTIAYGKYLEIEQLENNIFSFSCDQEEFNNIWFDYFDLGTDYSLFKSNIDPDDLFLKSAVEYGKGIRILKQELWETLITFIISQRKSIPAIRTCVESLCSSYGKPIKVPDKTVYSFPDASALAQVPFEELKSHGLGYRDKYISQLSSKVYYKEFDLDNIYNLNFNDAYNYLLTIYGVGAKIANCVMLFAYHGIDAFPKDVWINRIIKNEYNGNFDTDRYFGYAGVIQQYMFYYVRSSEYAEFAR